MSCQSDASGEDARRETDHLPNKLVAYKEKHTFVKSEGFKTKRYEKESSQWIERNAPIKSKSKQFKSGASQGVCVGIGTAADKILLHHGIGAAANAEVNAGKAECKTSVAEVSGLKFLDAGADARVGNAAAGASASPVEVQAFSKACGAEAGAHAGLVEGVLEAKVRTVTGEAQARAGVGLVDIGARAGKDLILNVSCTIIISLLYIYAVILTIKYNVFFLF